MRPESLKTGDGLALGAAAQPIDLGFGGGEIGLCNIAAQFLRNAVPEQN
ncbi:hypothetical protein [Paracoccus sp. IB05]|nr:hypothetical protein [Paracoccus sp. IB05]MBJ2149885.1 hypothetical protein [Paracoccus sp. IB05]